MGGRGPFKHRAGASRCTPWGAWRILRSRGTGLDNRPRTPQQTGKLEFRARNSDGGQKSWGQLELGPEE